MVSEKLNESFYKITGSYEQIQPIIRKLTATEMEYKVTPFSSGFVKNEIPFYRITQAEDPLEKIIVVPSGLVPFLGSFGVNYVQGNEFSKNEVNEWIENFKLQLPFEPYDYQELAIRESILKQQQLVLAATGSGKSTIIAGIVEFFRRKGLKGLILVPNISLTLQLLQDIKDYHLPELAENTRIIGGDNNEKILDKDLTISTWQSMLKLIESSTPKECGLLELDYIVVDECVHPETQITLKGGSKRISDIKDGDEVLTINEETMRKEYNKVVKLHKNISSEQMYIINNDIKITGNHKVLTTKGWKRTDEIKKGDSIIYD